eukprot:scaffold7356_cov249-Pinguiococcus_pyrenoidosus.AAC.2
MKTKQECLDSNSNSRKEHPFRYGRTRIGLAKIGASEHRFAHGVLEEASGCVRLCISSAFGVVSYRCYRTSQ